MTYLPFLFALLAGLLIWLYFKNERGRGRGGSFATLERYSVNLTKMAKINKLDPVIGRQKEIARVVQILSRRTKNNPVLIGKAGIGKTAIVNGLALAIKNKQVPSALNQKRVLSLDLGAILAGTKYRGEFEQRLKKILDEIVAAQRTIILFIDEIHILSETSGAEGALDAVDILKPLLSGGDLQVVGTTTKEEYDKYIVNDKTLARRLQPVYVAEPNIWQSREILAGIKGVYEKYHRVIIANAALDEAVSSTKYITDRAYPDKAIDALDEACSMVKLNQLSQKDKNRRPTVSAKHIRAVVLEWRKNRQNNV